MKSLPFFHDKLEEVIKAGNAGKNTTRTLNTNRPSNFWVQRRRSHPKTVFSERSLSDFSRFTIYSCSSFFLVSFEHAHTHTHVYSIYRHVCTHTTTRWASLRSISLFVFKKYEKSFEYSTPLGLISLFGGLFHNSSRLHENEMNVLLGEREAQFPHSVHVFVQRYSILTYLNSSLFSTALSRPNSN